MGVVRSHRPRYERGILLVDSLPMGVTRLEEAGLSLEVIRQPHRLNPQGSCACSPPGCPDLRLNFILQGQVYYSQCLDSRGIATTSQIEYKYPPHFKSE